MPDKKRRRALLALLGAVLIWGTTYVSTKQAISQVPPVTLAFIRNVLACLVLLPFFLRDPGRRRRVPWGSLALLGFSGSFLYLSLQNWGLYYTSASAGSLIQGSIPIIIAVFSIIFFGERVNIYRTLGIILAIAGVAGLVFLGGEVQGGSRPVLGNLLMLVSSLAWGAYTVLNKRFNLNISPVMATLATFFFGLLFLLPFTIMEMRGFNYALSWLTVANVLYLGVAAMALPIFLWNYALLYYDASEAGLFINLVPVFSVICAVLFLGEQVNAGQLAAGAVVILGVLVSSGFDIRHKAQESRAGGQSP